MTDFSTSQAVDAALAAELLRALQQLDSVADALDRRDTAAAEVYLNAARATVRNVRAALTEAKTPLRKLAAVHEWIDVAHDSGEPQR